MILSIPATIDVLHGIWRLKRCVIPRVVLLFYTTRGVTHRWGGKEPSIPRIPQLIQHTAPPGRGHPPPLRQFYILAARVCPEFFQIGD